MFMSKNGILKENIIIKTFFFLFILNYLRYYISVDPVTAGLVIWIHGKFFLETE